MKILMMSNTYLPHVGGVSNSISAFTDILLERGHEVVVVAPEYEDYEDDGDNIIRMPAIQKFNGTDFSVSLPIPGFLDKHLKDFEPDVIHAHHPYLLGTTAVRISTKYNRPLLYTYHTMFEKYTHYAPVDLPRMREFVVSLSVGYCNLVDTVIAPSQSVADVLRDRQVQTPMAIIPSGIDVERFGNGDGVRIREFCGIARDARVVGHIGRLAPEKNLEFLGQAVISFLQDDTEAHFLLAGYGPMAEVLKQEFHDAGLDKRVHFLGKLRGQDVVDVYHAMDLFVFSSQSETQGLVLAEAMAAGTPVVAVDAPGVREIIHDGVNGYMLDREERDTFIQAMHKFFALSDDQRQMLIHEARETAPSLSVDNCVTQLLSVYEKTMREYRADHDRDESLWRKSIEQIKTEWELFTNLSHAVGDAFQSDDSEKSQA